MARRPDRLRYFLSWGWIDLLGSVPGLPFLRFLWLPHLIRTGWRLRRTTPAEVRLQARRRLAESTLLVVGAVTVVLVTACSIAIVLVEAGAPNANIVTGGDAVWWAIVTIASVGYGDYYPVTRWGRVIGVALMFGGVTLFSVLTSFIAAAFVGREPGERGRVGGAAPGGGRAGPRRRAAAGVARARGREDGRPAARPVLSRARRSRRRRPRSASRAGGGGIHSTAAASSARGRAGSGAARGPFMGRAGRWDGGAGRLSSPQEIGPG